MSAAFASYLSTIALALSALFWVIAAVTAPVIQHITWDALPKSLVTRQRIAGWANALAALLAAIGVASQAYANAIG